VTVITRQRGDPCPVVVDSNRNIGVNLGWGPRYFGDFYAQGYGVNKQTGQFAPWGGGVGSPGFGQNTGFNFGLPLGAGILRQPPGMMQDCNQVVPNNGVSNQLVQNQPQSSSSSKVIVAG